MNKLKIIFTIFITCSALVFTYLTCEQIEVDNNDVYYCRPIEFWCYQKPNPNDEYYHEYYIYNTKDDKYYNSYLYGTYSALKKDFIEAEQESNEEIHYNTDFPKNIQDNNLIYSYYDNDEYIYITLDDNYKLIGYSFEY